MAGAKRGAYRRTSRAGVAVVPAGALQNTEVTVSKTKHVENAAQVRFSERWRATEGLTEGPGGPGRPLSPGRPRAPYTETTKRCFRRGGCEPGDKSGALGTYHGSGDAVLSVDAVLSLQTDTQEDKDELCGSEDF